MSESDQRIGANVARYREAMNASQTQVSMFMRSMGFKWTQTTVWSIEKGERPLRLAEAEHLARYLSKHPMDLLFDDRFGELEDSIREYRRVKRDFENEYATVLEAYVRLAAATGELSAEDHYTEYAHRLLDHAQELIHTADPLIEIQRHEQWAAERSEDAKHAIEAMHQRSQKRDHDPRKQEHWTPWPPEEWEDHDDGDD